MRSGKPGQTSAKRAMASVGGGLRVDVGREALAEQREHVAARRGQRRVGRGLAGRLDPRRARPGRPARASAAAASRSSSVKPMSIVPAPRLLARPGGEVGQAVEQHHDLDHRPGLAPARRRGQRRRARAVRSGSALESTAPARHLLAARQQRRRPRAPSSSTRTRSTGASVRHPRPGRLRRRAQRAGHRAHPAAGEAPRAGRRRPPRRGRGRSRRTPCPDPPAPASVPIRPWIANGTRTASDGIPARSSAIEPVEELGADRLQPALAVGAARAAAAARAPPRPPSAAPTRRSRRRRPRDQSRGQLRVGALAARPGHDPAPVGQRREQVRLVRRRRRSPWAARSRSSMISRAQQRQRVGARARRARPATAPRSRRRRRRCRGARAPRRRGRRGPGRRRRRARCGRRR